jgi:hypothetical protein
LAAFFYFMLPETPITRLVVRSSGEPDPKYAQHPRTSEVRDMSRMSKLFTGVALGTSGGTILNGVLTKLSPDEWSAIGVLAGIAGILVTGLINWYFKRKVANAQVKALEKYGPAVKVGDD